MDRKRAILGVLLTFAAWGCWQAMEIVPNYSPAETALLVAGYVACGLALYVFFLAFRSPVS